MTKKELVKEIVKQLVIKRLRERQEPPTIEPNRIGKVEFYTSRLPILEKSLRILMTSKYRHFVKDIAIISPKPTTYKIVLNNDYFIYLTYNDGAITAQVNGKNYSVINLEEAQRASKAITELLKFTTANIAKQESSNDGLDSVEGGGFGSGGSGGGASIPDSGDDNGIPNNDGSELGAKESDPNFDVDKILNSK